MDLRETEETTELVLDRMENSLNSLEQMSLDSINITDQIVMRIGEIRECAEDMKECKKRDGKCMFELVSRLLDDLLEIAFEINNVSHDLEKETVYQRETLENIKQIVGFLYAMSDE